MKRFHQRPLRHHQKGVTAIIVGLCIVVLIGFLGLVADLGRLFITKTELSDAADACSLASAAELKGDVDSLNRAESAGMTVGQRNKVNFQRENVLILPNQDVTFSDQLTGDYRAKNAVTDPAEIAKMKYAKCTLPRTGIMPWFMQVMGAGAQTVTSHAIASLSPSQTNCAIPVGLCKQPLNEGDTCPHGEVADKFGLCTGEWYGSRFSSGNKSGFTGNFNLIDYSPTEGGGSSELAGLLTGAGQCDLNIDPDNPKPVGQSGVEQSLAKAWNTRFGIYKGNDNITNAPPDISGFTYTKKVWTSEFNAFSGSSLDINGIKQPNFQEARKTPPPPQTATNRTYQGDSATGLTLNGYDKSASAADLRSHGTDRRMVLMPIVNCADWTGSQTTPVLDFACVLMLQPMTDPTDETFIEYRGLSNLAGSPCISNAGLPGSGSGVGPKVPSLVR